MKNLKSLFFAFLALGLLSMPLAALDNSPSNYQCVPECIWAPASGGGTWVTEVQILCLSDGTNISSYFDWGTSWQSIPNWYTMNSNTAVRSSNILATLDAYDGSAFVYYGRVGAVEFFTQDTSHVIQVTARTVNGNYGKVFPGLNKVAMNLANVSHLMHIPYLSKNTTYRSTVGFFNPTGSSITVTIYLMNPASYSYIGTYELVIPGWNFVAHDPFAQAGLTSSWTHTYMLVWPTAGSGQLFLFGAVSNNYTNDPNAIVAVSR